MIEFRYVECFWSTSVLVKKEEKYCIGVGLKHRIAGFNVKCGNFAFMLGGPYSSAVVTNATLTGSVRGR